MVFYGEGEGFCVKMTNTGHLHAAGDGPEGTILEGLELIDVALTEIGEPYWGSVGDEGADERFVGDHEGFLMLAPRSAS